MHPGVTRVCKWPARALWTVPTQQTQPHLNIQRSEIDPPNPTCTPLLLRQVQSTPSPIGLEDTINISCCACNTPERSQPNTHRRRPEAQVVASIIIIIFLGAICLDACPVLDVACSNRSSTKPSWWEDFGILWDDQSIYLNRRDSTFVSHNQSQILLLSTVVLGVATFPKSRKQNWHQLGRGGTFRGFKFIAGGVACEDGSPLQKYTINCHTWQIG